VVHCGGGIAYNKEEFETITARGLDLSPVCEVLIEESLLGWKSSRWRSPKPQNSQNPYLNLNNFIQMDNNKETVTL